MRTNRIRATVLAAATAALALSLTACGSGDSDSDSDSGAKADRGTGKSVDATVDASKGSEESGTDETSKPSGGTVQADSAQGSGADTSNNTNAQPCKGDEMSYSVLHRFPAEQGEHLLIAAVNADTKPCWVTSYPSVMLGDTTNVLPHTSKDAPGGGTKITIKPGGKVYSAVALFTDGDKTNTSSSLSLALRDQTGDTGPGYSSEAFDGKGAPSEFTWDTAEVTNWNTTKPYDF
ncbi:DUF4232 domain-containing protein [Streptomyces sp. MZ04]|uniref:DUF4232 domain-containing protein n=1 Tax=Streptomyces sp. MZ04 TaxID=2559236 RepID=UPI00107E73E2|nr:DUF4232 domain-containing protein [Streptomyces sp. MZ04]TGB03055.1 DUF4232 domain-containing protein [Streptomyces sp. MZ04]